MTFIVRFTIDAQGRIHGVLERVKTGAKYPFDDFSAVGPLMARLAKEELSAGGDTDA